jgi:biotin carboxylase
MKRLMIVGASVLQLPGILKAKEMGLYVGVVDYNPKAIGIPFADEYFNASTMDEDAVLRAAKEFRPDGIMTLATDMPMRGVAKVSEKLGLRSISYSTAIKATDKFEMIKAFQASQVACPWYFAVDSLDELKTLQSRLSFPCIMKPTDNAGSHGVILAHNFEELIDSYDYSHESSRHGKVILEEYLEGEEVSVEVMVMDGVAHVIQITDKLTTGAPYFVEMGHSQPSRHPEAVKEQIRKLASDACAAVGITMGPAHVEIMITQAGPVMIELGARMGGDNITTALVPLSTGVDMVKAAIEIALGTTPDIRKTLDRGSAIRYFDVPFGIIKSISGAEQAKEIPGVKDIVFTKGVGERSTPIHCSNDRIGFVIAQGRDADEAIRICEEVMRTIIIGIE